MPYSLEKIINLIRKTGDRRIILDENDNPAYVLLNFKDYQQLVGSNSSSLEEDSSGDIDDDIAVWKQTEKEESMEDWSNLASSDEEKSLNQANNDSEKDNSDQKYYFEPIE